MNLGAGITTFIYPLTGKQNCHSQNLMKDDDVMMSQVLPNISSSHVLM